MKMKSIATLVLFLVCLIAHGQTPQVISYQGMILDPANGEPVANGDHVVKFGFYDQATAGNLKWESSAIAVTTFKGLYATMIPVPPATTWDVPLFVELTVDGVVLNTRLQLSTVPYAFKAVVADAAISMNAQGLTGTISDQRLNSNLQDLADGSLSGSKVGSGIPAENVDNGILNIARIPDFDATKITSGTIAAERIPELDASKIISGTINSYLLPSGTAYVNALSAGVPSKVAIWSDTHELTADDGLHWNSTLNQLGIGTASPLASLHITHSNPPTHSSGTSMRIDNTYPSLAPKSGLEINMNSSANYVVSGLGVTVTETGTNAKRGIYVDVNSSANNQNVYGLQVDIDGDCNGSHHGVYTIAGGDGTGDNNGVYGEANGGGTGNQRGIFGKAAGDGMGDKYGVRGEATGGKTGENVVARYGVYGSATKTAGTATTHYGIYGIASGATNNYAVYADGNLKVTGNINYAGTLVDDMPSDRQLKKNILPLRESLSSILQLRPSNYYFRTKEFSRLALSEKKQYGLIAQEVAEIFPELVTEKTMDEIRDDQGNITEQKLTYKALDYTSLIPVLIKGMQEQQAMIEELKAEVRKLKSLTSDQKQQPRVVKTSLKN